MIPMKSQAMRSSRLTSSQVRNKKSKNSSNRQSQSPTLASSYSQKSLWTHSYKNEPFPKQLRRKLWGKKFQFDINSEDQEEITAVVQQQEEGIEKKKKKLPHFKIIADQGEFLSKRNRIKSEFQFRSTRQKCKSVQSLKCLQQVLEQKKQQDQLGKLGKTKLSYFKDKNEFNLKKNKSSDSYTQIASKAQSLQNFCIPSATHNVPYEIQQSEAQQTKSVKLPGQKSIITAQIQKIIVDQLDSRKRKQQSKPQLIEQIPEQQKIQEQVDNLKLSKLRLSLEKFESQSQYLNQIRDGQFVKKSGRQSARSQNSDPCSLQQICTITHIQRNQQIKEGEIYEEIKQQGSSSEQQQDQVKYNH